MRIGDSMRVLSLWLFVAFPSSPGDYLLVRLFWQSMTVGHKLELDFVLGNNVVGTRVTF